MKHTNKMLVALALITALFVGYVLSSGPALQLMRLQHISFETWRTAYEPLTRAATAVGARDLLGRYFNYWEPPKAEDVF
jgi:hypothetical protein